MINCVVNLTNLPLDTLVENGAFLEAAGVISRTQHEMLIALSERKIKGWDFAMFEHIGFKHMAMRNVKNGPESHLGLLVQEALQHGWTCHEIGTALRNRPDWNHPHNTKLRWQLVQVQHGKLRPEHLV